MGSAPPKRTRMRGLGYVLLTVALLLGGFTVHRSTWQGTAGLHTWIETISVVLGLVTGAMALVRYYTKKSPTFLFLGTGFLGGALLDGYHALVTSSLIHGHILAALSDLTPWSGLMSPVFLSVLMCASVIARRREIARAKEVAIRESLVYVLVGIWVVATFLFFALLQVPPPFRPDLFIHRPVDFVPTLFFALAAIGYLQKDWWKSGDFEHCLVISLILYGVGRSGYLSFYTRPFDAQYFLGHGLKVLGHMTVLAGLFISMFSIFKAEARSAVDLLRANGLLAAQLEVERRLVCDLKETEHRATHDSLTGIHNRPAIMELLTREAARCKRTRQQMGVLIADIDHFKLINDTYGHPVGDEVLKQLVLRMALTLRPYDSLGRIGGEEFLILVQDCAPGEVVGVAERVRLSIANDNFVIGQFAIPVTVSLGVSAVEASTPDVDVAVQTADSLAQLLQFLHALRQHFPARTRQRLR
jgi:diguanylate cyclase (GGDEF)-like protein